MTGAKCYLFLSGFVVVVLESFEGLGFFLLVGLVLVSVSYG